MKGYFITATDTDAGKTFVSAGLLQAMSDQGYRTLGFKPVASGCVITEQGLRNDDALQLIQSANVSLDYENINPYSFEPAIAPHIAAQQAGVTIDINMINELVHQCSSHADFTLVEGVGGWLVPLNEQDTVADLARLIGFPVIVVVNMRLGCINHALLTIEAIKHTGLAIAGWIANQADSGQTMDYLEDNIAALEVRIPAPLLGIVPDLSQIELHEKSSFSNFIDLSKCK